MTHDTFTLHYTLHCLTLHYIVLYYITVHYITTTAPLLVRACARACVRREHSLPCPGCFWFLARPMPPRGVAGEKKNLNVKNVARAHYLLPRYFRLGLMGSARHVREAVWWARCVYGLSSLP